MSALSRGDDELMFGSALSSDLSHPLLVDHGDSTVGVPALDPENGPEGAKKPLLFRHMDLLYRLCADRAKTAAQNGLLITGVAKAEAASRMQDVVDKWFTELPAEYALESPDTHWDSEYKWVVFQRNYLLDVGSAIRKDGTRNLLHSIGKGLGMLVQVRSGPGSAVQTTLKRPRTISVPDAGHTRARSKPPAPDLA